MTQRVTRTGAARARGAATRQAATRRTTSKAYGTEEEHNEELDSVRFPPGVEPAFVKIGAGGTYNLGDYSSLRIDVAVTLPCYPEDLEDTYKRASEFVQEKLQSEEAAWLPNSRR